MSDKEPRTSLSAASIARITGVAYLAIFVLAIAANFAVLESVFVRGDVAATLDNVQSNETGFRLAMLALFLVLVVDLIVAWGF